MTGVRPVIETHALTRRFGERVAVDRVDFAGLNPEALFISGGRVLVLSDDGTRRRPGHDRDCKDLTPAEQGFRGMEVRP